MEVQTPSLQFGQWRHRSSAPVASLIVAPDYDDLIFDIFHLNYEFFTVSVTDKGLQAEQMVRTKVNDRRCGIGGCRIFLIAG